MYGLKNANLKKRIEEVLKLVNLLPFKNRVVNDCSGGMKRRCSLAAALLCEPELLILDEPTVGIDPSLRMEFWNYFETLAKRGITTLITTHYLQESVKCSNVGLIWKKIIKSGPPQMLREEVMKENNLSELPDMEDVFIHFTKSITQGGAI